MLSKIVFISALFLIAVTANAQNPLSGHTSVTTSPSTWSYTVFDDEAAGSSNYVGYFTLAVNAPVQVTGTPAGWTSDTDGSTYVLWYNTDTTLPYPHDIAPGSSLGGFAITSTVTTSDTLEYDLDSWDHSQDAPGPGTQGRVLAPSIVSAPDPSPLLALGLGSLGLGGFAFRRASHGR
jgi:hypothetical protein